MSSGTINDVLSLLTAVIEQQLRSEVSKAWPQRRFEVKVWHEGRGDDGLRLNAGVHLDEFFEVLSSSDPWRRPLNTVRHKPITVGITASGSPLWGMLEIVLRNALTIELFRLIYLEEAGVYPEGQGSMVLAPGCQGELERLTSKAIVEPLLELIGRDS